MSRKSWLWCLCLSSVLALTVGCDETTEGGEGGADGGGTDVEQDASTTPDHDSSIADVDSGNDQPVEDAGVVQDAAVEEDASIVMDVDAGDDAGTDAGMEVDTEIEIEGRWHSNYGGTETIDADKFDSAAVIEFDDEANYLITQNPATAKYSPSKFNKIVWTEIAGGGFYYCYVDYNKDTATAARDTTNTADATSPTTGGCGGFPWTYLVPAIEIDGRWHSDYGGIETIDSDTFKGYGTSEIVEYDNDDNYLITQNPADALYSPSKFNKLVWTEIANGSFYYCTIEYGKDTAAAARDTAKVADATHPEAGGCGSFPWTKLSPPIEVEGRWHSNFTGIETISSDAFENYGDSSDVVEYDNAHDYFITKNADDAPYFPGKFSKIVWTEIANGSFFYCFVDFGRDSAQEARETTETADATDPATTGCGGNHPWTKLSPPLEIEGNWHSDQGGLAYVESDYFEGVGITLTVEGDSGDVVEYDNTNNALFFKSSNDDKYSKIVWTQPANDAFYYCVVDSGLDTLVLAKASTMTADATDLDGEGCDGGAWTKLGARLEIEGVYHSSKSGTENLSSDKFLLQGVDLTIRAYDNVLNAMVTQNPSSAAVDPNKFSKIVWTDKVSGSLYYCVVDSGLDTFVDARDTTETADKTMLETGCDGGAWTKLSPTIAVQGVWNDGGPNFGISSDQWSGDPVISYDDHSAITQNLENTPDELKFNKVVWTGLDNNGFSYCFVSVNQDTAEAATANAGVATTTDLVTGCLGGVWTKANALSL